jgi:putative restriction endonuclease
LTDRGVLYATARALVEAEFPPSIAGDVLTAVGLDPDQVYGQAPATNTQDLVAQPRRLRSGGWPAQILEASDRQCAFCGYDGQLGSGPVGLAAAHVRWFDFDGPDALNNGLALCELHQELYDRGAAGLADDYRIRISSSLPARSQAGRRICGPADQLLRPSPGTPLPVTDYLRWHHTQVFKG